MAKARCMCFVWLVAAITLSRIDGLTTERTSREWLTSPPPNVSIEWDSVTAVSKTSCTLQVVVNPLLRRDVPVHDQIFESLAALGADYVRYVPWLPYPKLSVAELQPPSGTALCVLLNGEDGNNISLNETAVISCPQGTIDKIDFASFGTPMGSCNSLVQGKCHGENTSSIVSSTCLGKSSCIVPTGMFDDPCFNVSKRFYVQVQCSPATNHTYWDFSLIDPIMEDFMNAMKNHSVVINFSTVPVWLYNTTARVLYPDNPDREEDGRYSQGKDLVDATGKDLGDFYGRLASYYTQGGFTDEYGQEHKSNYHYDFQYWECLNEVEDEHRNTPESYTFVYDSMVQGIRRHADPQHKMKFVGMALQQHYEYSWYEYFLNISNHVSTDIPLDVISFHFYAHCTSRTDPEAYTQFFPKADIFIEECKKIISIRDSLSPHTRLDVDEMGAILPGDNNPSAPMFPPVFYNAAGALYAYLFGRLSEIGVDILGESQLVGYPALPELNLQPQFPSVALVNWTNGLGNPRYHVLKVLIENFKADNKLVTTRILRDGPANPQFCGYVPNQAPLAIQCKDANATVDKIFFASYGTVQGSTCGNYSVGKCNAANSTDIVEKACLGKTTCSIDASTPIFGDPCPFTFKHLVVEAHCTTGPGSATGGDLGDTYAQGFTAQDGSSRRLLLVNKTLDVQSMLVSEAKGATAIIVDDTRPTGPPIVTRLSSDTVQMGPYAVFVLTDLAP